MKSAENLSQNNTTPHNLLITAVNFLPNCLQEKCRNLVAGIMLKIAVSVSNPEEIMEMETLDSHLCRMGISFKDIMIVFKNGTQMTAAEWYEKSNSTRYEGKLLANVTMVDVLRTYVFAETRR